MKESLKQIISASSILVGFLLLLIVGGAAPKMQVGGDIVQFDMFASKTYLRLDGTNAPDVPEGTIFRFPSSVTITDGTNIAQHFTESHIFSASPFVEAAERAGWASLQVGFIFMFDAGGGPVALGHWEDGEVKEWETFIPGDLGAPERNLCTIVRNETGEIELRGLKRVAG